MTLWFRDISAEGKQNLYSILSNILHFARAISKQEIEHNKSIDFEKFNLGKDQFGYYLAGLLEGDGHISLPFLGNTTLNRVLNPRIVLITHVNNIELFLYIQHMLKGVGRFQLVNNNTIRYIIGDIKGITLVINTIHGKLRTPKNETFNKLISFINKKYDLTIPTSNIDESDLLLNSWFAGFTEADGHFGVKIVDYKPKSNTRIRSVSKNTSLKFRLDQRYFDKQTSLSMWNMMEKIAQFLSCKISVYETNNNKVISLSVSSIEKLKNIIYYFNKYPLLGTKYKDFKDWELVYNMTISMEHLNNNDRYKIRLIQSNMNSKRIDQKSFLSIQPLKANMLIPVLLIILISTYSFNMSIIDLNSLICMAKDSNILESTV
jgi:hypothetical protein